jgi:Holliday junction resolvase RusA-like endonuclease
LTALYVAIPGDPFAQPRAGRRIITPASGRAFVQTFTPPAAASWREGAQGAMLAALASAGRRPPYIVEVPVRITVEAVYRLGRHHWKKRAPVPRARKGTNPDYDNIAKAVGDAGNGLLWKDDGQIAVALIEKWWGAQGETPGVYVTVDYA